MTAKADPVKVNPQEMIARDVNCSQGPRMKKGVILFGIAICGGVIGVGFEKLLASARLSGSASVAGQTLSDLSRELELEKERSGTYPESIAALRVGSSSSEFSLALLQRVVYRKTTEGYVAFVGNRQVVYIERGKGARFE